MTVTLDLQGKPQGTGQVQGSLNGPERVAARCEALYFKSPVPYMPGEELSCVAEFSVDDESDLTICIEFLLKVVRMDTDVDSTAFGIACLIQDERGCKLHHLT